MRRSIKQLSIFLSIFLYLIISIPVYAGLDDLISPEDYDLSKDSLIEEKDEKKKEDGIKAIQPIEPSIQPDEPSIKTSTIDPSIETPKENTTEAIDLEKSQSKPEPFEPSNKIKPLFEREEPGKEKETETTKTEADKAAEAFENSPLDLSDDGKQKRSGEASTGKVIGIMLTVLAIAIIFLVFWYQKHLKGKMKSSGVPISVLGQTFMDGSTRIILLKVGNKVLVLAKSHQFCNTLDIITDQDEVNLLTLGSGVDQNDKDFNRILKDMKKQEDKPSAPIPHEAEIKQEINELKQKLGKLS